jgi:6-phospho-3-hexuloisomerase
MEFQDLADLFSEDQRQAARLVNENQLEQFADAIQSSERIFLQGKGRTGLVIEMFAMRLVHLGYQAFIIGHSTTPKYSTRDLLILASGSGTTEGLILTAQQAQRIGGKLFILTRNPEAPLSSYAQNSLIIPNPKLEHGALANSKILSGTLFEHALLVTLDGLCVLLAEKTGQDLNAMSDRHVTIE